jgi:hypothetical protein
MRKSRTASSGPSVAATPQSSSQITTIMASQSPPPRESVEAPHTDTPVKMETTATTTSAPSSRGVSKSDLEIMKGIVDHLTEAKEE